MDTKFWGPGLWVGLHSIAHNYDPKKHNPAEFKRFFKDIGNVLPCIYCRQSYQEFYKETPIDPFLKQEGGLAVWLYLIHNKVNKKLRDSGEYVAPDPTFDEVWKKYDRHKVKNCKIKKSCTTSQFSKNRKS